MTGWHDLLLAPFVDFTFMRRALAACLALSLGSGPMGVFLVLRRMSLMGDALSHAVLPGAAIGFLLGGLSLTAMGLGGFVAGLSVALLAGVVSRLTRPRAGATREDSSFAAFYLISLALGVMIVSLHGNNVDLMHVLFGTILAVDDTALILVASIASLTVTVFALIYRPLVAECFDPGFLRAQGGGGAWVHLLFLTLVVLNLVAGFQALGTLMAVGLMMLPAIAARLWAKTVPGLVGVAVLLSFLSGYGGLVLSFAGNLPSGPGIVLTAGGFYLLSLLFGRVGGLLPRLFPSHPLEA